MYLIVKNVTTRDIVVYRATRQQAQAFLTNEDLPQELAGWPVLSTIDLGNSGLTSKDLLSLYNSVSSPPLVKFQSRTQGVGRTFGILDQIAKPYDLDSQEEPAKEEPAKKEPAKEEPAKSRGARKKGVISLLPQEKVYPCRAGTKQAALVDALWKGATLQELVDACSATPSGKRDWSVASVRSGIYWDVNKIKGYGVRTDASGEEPRYFLVLPEGYNSPPPHNVRKDA